MGEQHDPSQGKAYTHGYSDEHRQFLSIRTVGRFAKFFAAHLKPGMRLLDCGQGALTRSLAEIVSPG